MSNQMNSKSKTLIIGILCFLFTFLVISLLQWLSNVSHIRLPTHIQPSMYNITIETCMEEEDPRTRFRFIGDVQIRVKSKSRTKFLIMHSQDLRYNLIEYWAESAPLERFKMKRTSFYLDSDRIMFEMKHDLFPNHLYVLHFKYTGLIRNESVGVFWREYTDSKNQKRWMIATQFQPNGARKAFPCFDEPHFKARFRMSIIRPKHMKSFSNRARACSSMKSGLMVDTFKITPIMPIYTLAFLIAPYEELSDGNFSILARTEDIQKTKFSLEISKKILAVLSIYLNMNYYDMGVEKLTLVAVPNLDFNGMENWGLIFILRESLLYNENSNSKLTRERITLLIAHELAHMWFGNLVTCDWWTSLWINEGFATYFSYLSQALLESNSTFIEEIFFENVLRRSLSIDSSNKNALTAERKEVSRNYFESLTYLKGASVIHMVRHIVGENGFRESLQNFLSANKYKTATLDTIKAVWREYWPVHFLNYIDAFFNGFVNEVGYPLITIELDKNGYKFAISQEVFVETVSQVADTSLIFTVPISFTTNVDLNFSRTVPDFFLSTRKVIYTLSSSSPASWLIANIQATSYYRVNYNRRNWLRIGEALQAYNWSGIPLLNRVKIIDDIEQLFCIRRVDSSLAMHVLGYLHTESSYFPWKAALNYIHNILRHSKLTHSATTAYMQNITHRAYAGLGFLNKSTDDSSTIQNREQIIPIACKYGNPACLDEVKFFFNKPEELKSLPSYLRLVVYCNSIRLGNQTTYERIFNLYLNQNDTGEKLLLMQALGCLGDPVAIENHFWNIMKSPLSNKHKITALGTLYSENDGNYFQVYKLITDNYERASIILEKETIVAYLISNISKQFTERFQKQDLIDFVETTIKIKCTNAFKVLKDAVKKLNIGHICL